MPIISSRPIRYCNDAEQYNSYSSTKIYLDEHHNLPGVIQKDALSACFYAEVDILANL